MDSNKKTIPMKIINADTNEVTELTYPAYLFNKKSFVSACRDGQIKIVEYFIKNLDHIDLMEGFECALHEKHFDLCSKIIDAIPDLTIKDFRLFELASGELGQIDLLKKLFELINTVSIDQVKLAARKSFETAAQFYQINILEFLFNEGYFFNDEDEKSILKKLIENYKYNKYVRDAESIDLKNEFIKTFKWLEDHDITLVVHDVYLMAETCCMDRDIFLLVFTSIKKSNSDKIVGEFLKEIIRETVGKNNKIFMKELINYGIKPENFIQDLLFRMNNENYDLIYELIDLNVKFTNDQLYDLFTNTISKLSGHFFILVNRLHINLKTYPFNKKIINKALEYSSLDFNRALHEIVDYRGHLDIDFCNQLAHNMNMRTIVKWLDEIGINLTKDNFSSSLSTACIFSNSEYILFCLERKFVTPDEVREKYSEISFGNNTSFGVEAIIAEFNKSI